MLPKMVLVGHDGKAVKAWAVVQSIHDLVRNASEFRQDGLLLKLTTIKRTNEILDIQQRQGQY